MHIKQITIQGFKTYKDKTVVEDLSPHHNVVVGRNGSGKSNFFAAIRFVLSDAYTHMSREERQSLIHEGSGTTVMSAYVEILFDNSDRRLPVASDEVSIRRTIGLKKDEYSLDRRAASKADIMNLLETAGFSRSNPYYIVPQGRITALTNAKDSERLALLKEVAGAGVFETRLRDSVREMAASEKKHAETDEMLRLFQMRLDDLETEKEQLRAFQACDRERKCVDYALQDRELSQISTALDALDAVRDDEAQKGETLAADLNARDDQLAKLQRQAAEIRGRIAELDSVDRRTAQEDLSELLQAKAEAEVRLQEVSAAAESRNQRQAELRARLAAADEQIAALEAQRDAAVRRLAEAREAETAAKTRLDQLETSQQMLYSKQGRSAKFRSQAARDKYLRAEIRQTEQTLAREAQTEAALAKEIAQLEKRAEECRKRSRQLGNDAAQLAAETVEKLAVRRAELQAEHTKLVDDRKQLWRSEAKLEARLSSVTRENLRRAERSVADTMDRAQSAGLDAVQRISRRLGLSGVFGPLGELIEVSEKYKTAVETTAGNSLFHVVVDTDETASRVMEELTRERAGRVTFMPLNRLSPGSARYPEDTSECIPLAQKIRAAPEISVAVQQVFGKTVVAVNLERGSYFSREYNLHAVTLDGDRVDKKGILSGGYVPRGASRLDALRELRQWRRQSREEEAELVRLRREIEARDAEVTAVASRLSGVKAELAQIETRRAEAAAAAAAASTELRHIEDRLRMQRSAAENTQALRHTLEAQLEALQAELRQPYMTGLSAEETAELAAVNEELPVAEEAAARAGVARAEAEHTVALLVAELEESLRPSRAETERELLEVTAELGGVPGGAAVATVAELEEEISKLAGQISELESKTREMDTETDTLRAKLAEIEAETEKLTKEQRATLKKLESHQKSLERNLARKALLIQRREELQKKIRELGVLPEEAFHEKYRSEPSEQLSARLNQLNEELKQFGPVNKRALDQYNSFTKQKEKLLQRRDELTAGKQAIEELMTVLAQRKDEAIERTFKQVSKGFSDIFGKLVPAGTGRLVMQRRMDEEMADASDEDEGMSSDDGRPEGRNNSNVSVENYVGVSISVSFNSKTNEQQRIEQLSGGQKSLCAIALILAIQLCDPAPFYLFDEIDANLDTQYRTAVANLVHSLSEDGQFICTTFRPEMLNVADKFYGVLFNNKVSRVQEITRDEALGFVEGQK